MSNEEIFAQMGKDVSDLLQASLDREITIWMTKDLFKKLCPEEFLLQKGSAMTTLFGCRSKVVISPRAGMQWIVGHEGKADEGE